MNLTKGSISIIKNMLVWLFHHKKYVSLAIFIFLLFLFFSVFFSVFVIYILFFALIHTKKQTNKKHCNKKHLACWLKISAQNILK